MEKLSETKKRDSSADESDDKLMRQRRSGDDAIEYLAERAKVSYHLKAEDLKMRKEHHTLEREKMEVLREQQMQNAIATRWHAERHAESHAAATVTKPTAVAQLSDDDDDDAGATVAVKSSDGVIGKK